MRMMVGAAGFEPTTPCPPGRCATRLRYAPTEKTKMNSTMPSFPTDRDYIDDAQEVRRSTQAQGCGFGEHAVCEE